MRLFVAVYPPAEAIADLAAVWTAPPGVRPMPVAQWHLTLAFLGEVADDAHVQAGLAATAARHAPLRLQLTGGGAFPRQGVLWVGLGGELDRLSRLADDVHAACRSAGVALADRPYRPHLTVGRGRPHAPGDVLSSYAGPVWTAERLVLVRSELGRGPARHSERAAWPLSSPGAGPGG